jgi:leucyl aminopeptidase (aminopeptidase T)
MADLERAVDAVIGDCLAVADGEDVLVVVDRATRELGEGLRAAAGTRGADAVLAVMDERSNDGAEPPSTIAAALAAADVFVAPTARSLSHTVARKAASDAGARGATLPGVTADMLARLMDVDFATLRARGRALAVLLDEADTAHVTCPRGTDLTLDLRDRSGIADDGDLRARGAFGNLPCGEGFIAPAGGEGTVVACSLAAIGLTPADTPARLTVSDGRLTRASGADEGAELLRRLREHGPQGTNLAELGIGTNPAAALRGNILEDEKILGTVHVAFGASAGIGGTVWVPVHLDVLIADPTLTVGATTVLDEGRFALEPA